MNLGRRCSPRIVAVAAVFLLGGLFLFLSFRAYHRQIHQTQPGILPKDPAASVVQGPEKILPMELITGTGGDLNAYAPIVERNLFAPDRRAWSPPLAESEPESALISPGAWNIRLYGTQMSAQEKIGLFYFGGFTSKNKHRLLYEGELAQDDGEPEGHNAFEVVAIEKDKATLRDPGGRTFDVGLYDHQRASPSPELSPVAPSGPTIIRGGTPPRDKEDVAQEPAPPTQEEPAPAAQPETSPPPLIPIQNHEEMERLVEEGQMRKIMTPFGPIYRPIQQQSP